ncbi:MAG: EAL domain-containing protein [Clostridia bacterium]
MPSLKTILVVDDNFVNRTILAKILSEAYEVLQAEDGQVALALLDARRDEIAAVMLDLVMPVMDGYAVLSFLQGDARYHNLPVIVTTENNDIDNEIKVLGLGAWDFVSKPYNPNIIRFRLKNAIDRSQLTALKQLKYLAEYDALTGIYNKTRFFDAVREMLNANRATRFAFLRFDVDRFQLINSFFGTSEGDKLLIYIARHLAEESNGRPTHLYGRIASDIFGFCMPYDRETTETMIGRAKKVLAKYNPNYDIVPSIGVYVIDDNTISVEEMYNRATLAAKTCKGNYVDYYAYYDESMSTALASEQEITNDMNFALASGQFEIYLQPQYNIHTKLPCGAEVLVRWQHPKKGLLAPGKFIPVFERNGFITKLDHYVWEQACKCLRRWIDQGIKPHPLSVNISRVNVYNPKLAEMLLDLVNQYEIDPSLLNLELTESAYTDNPVAMCKTMAKLQSHGFVIMMDDFGSGYSSLSLLKDIDIDILKIDMGFLSKAKTPGRGENIVASVIRMAKWLNIPVIAEGAETSEQVSFLRSVGCDYVQGYYFARPMPVSAYEQLFRSRPFDAKQIADTHYERFHYDDLFSSDPEMASSFCNNLQAAAIYEFSDDHLEMIRANEAYYALLGHDTTWANMPGILNFVDEAYQTSLLSAFRTCASTKAVCECEYLRNRLSAAPLWISIHLRYVATVNDKYIVIGELTDITMRKEVAFELQKYRQSLSGGDHDRHTVLIVDDAPINRAVLKKILQGGFSFFEAENGEDAITLLKTYKHQIDLILLDIVMPKMDGKAFLQYKKESPELDGIPVIMITSDDSPAQQISTLSLGANDYIVKPFIPEVVIRRVKNVLESNRRFREMVREYNDLSEQVKMDLMTGLLNRRSVEGMIARHLERATGPCAMLMLDIDNFKKINDTCGHAFGDKVIEAVATKLVGTFRKADIIARMGGDEFAVFMEDVPDLALVEMKAHSLCRNVAEILIDGKNPGITCSVGVALSSEHTHSFDALYQNADKALYNAKYRGRNTVSIYMQEATIPSFIPWTSDAHNVLNAIDDIIYLCDKQTHELLYANACACKFAGVTLETYRGRTCHDVFMHKSVPCEFCALAKMSEDAVYTRLFRVPNTSQIFLMRGRDIPRDGTVMHLELAVDATHVEHKDLYWEEANTHEKP